MPDVWAGEKQQIKCPGKTTAYRRKFVSFVKGWWWYVGVVTERRPPECKRPKTKVTGIDEEEKGCSLAKSFD